MTKNELHQLRRQVRYKLFRLRTEALTTAAAETDKTGKVKITHSEVDDDFKDKFIGNPVFGLTNGFADFSVTWDVSEENPYAMVSRDKSVDQEWNEHLEAVVKDLPVS